MNASKLKEIKLEFLDALTKGESMTSLCNLAAKHCNIPVAVCITTHTILAKSFDYTPDLLQEYENVCFLLTIKTSISITQTSMPFCQTKKLLSACIPLFVTNISIAAVFTAVICWLF